MHRRPAFSTAPCRRTPTRRRAMEPLWRPGVTCARRARSAGLRSDPRLPQTGATTSTFAVASTPPNRRITTDAGPELLQMLVEDDLGAIDLDARLGGERAHDLGLADGAEELPLRARARGDR